VSELTLQVVEVPVSTLHPNPWNPNKMDDRTFEAARESIRHYGFIDPVMVRPHPELAGEWQIVDGEHRWRAARAEERETVFITPLDLTDAQAMRLTVIANETRGQADVVDLAKLMTTLADELGEEALLGLAIGPRELDQLLEIGKSDWDNFDFDKKPRETGRTVTQIIELRYDDEQRERYRRLVAFLGRELSLADDEAVVLAALDSMREGVSQTSP
jgi:ParB/Sulfiredoxin domain